VTQRRVCIIKFAVYLVTDNMIKDLILLTKYPSVAGIIIVIWAGLAALVLIYPDFPLIKALITSIVASVIIAYFGFRVEKSL